MRKVLFVFTGGTISMKQDSDRGGAVPALSGEAILAYDPALRALCVPEVVDFGRYPGPHMTPPRIWELTKVLERGLADPGVVGAVVTHGTDTLEETAYFCDLQHTSDKPVCFVGAMRSANELSYDGPANLHAAARVALAEESREQGVLVVLNMMIHAASEATKTDTQQVETFQSPMFGPLGIVDADRVLYGRKLTNRPVIAAPSFEERVDMFPMYSGADGRFIDYAVESGAQGLVIEGTGRGNVPPAVVPAIRRAVERIPVVLSSRCVHGRVLDTYAYEGSGHELRQMGVYFAGTLRGAKARIRLMLALGRTRDRAGLRRLLEEGSY